MTTDSELATLQEKVKRLTHDRDVAMKMAARSDQMLKDMKTEMENYRRLWQHAESRKIYDPLSLIPVEKKKRTVSDWIMTGIFIAVATAITYVLGWVLVWPKE